MTTVTMPQDVVTTPGRLPHHCMRCNREATAVVTRPVVEPAARDPKAARVDSGPLAHPGPASELGAVLAGVGMILFGLWRLRTSRRHWARALWLLVMLEGVGVTLLVVLGFFVDRLPPALILPVVAGLLPSLFVMVLVAGDEPPADREQLHAHIPVCHRHRTHWQRYRRLVAAFSLGSVLYVVGLVVLAVRLAGSPVAPDSKSGEWIFFGLLGLIALLGVAAYFCRAPIKAVYGPGRTVVLSGVSDKWARERTAG
jgi:hypothetical protein